MVLLTDVGGGGVPGNAAVARSSEKVLILLEVLFLLDEEGIHVVSLFLFLFLLLSSHSLGLRVLLNLRVLLYLLRCNRLLSCLLNRWLGEFLLGLLLLLLGGLR